MQVCSVWPTQKERNKMSKNVYNPVNSDDMKKSRKIKINLSTIKSVDGKKEEFMWRIVTLLDRLVDDER